MASPDDPARAALYAELAAQARRLPERTGGGAGRRSPVVAYLVWFFLGWLGVHRLYLNRVPSGLAMMVLGVAGVALNVSGEGYWPVTAVGLWVLFDGTQVRKWLVEVNRGK